MAGTAPCLSGRFTDPGAQNGYTVSIDWNSASPGTDTSTMTLEPGETSFAADPHTYASGGIYTIQVTVSDGSSPNQDGPFTYAWDVTLQAADGTTTEHFATGSDDTLDFPVTQVGTYAVSLVVTDANHVSSNPAAWSVEVDNLPPTVSLSLGGATEGSSCSASISATDPGTDLVGGKWTLDWGDGQTSSGTIASVNQDGGWSNTVTHTYCDDFGDRLVTATVTDANGGWDADREWTPIANVGDSLSLTTSTTTYYALEGGTLTLDPIGYSDPGFASAGQLHYTINWGDGYGLGAPNTIEGAAPTLANPTPLTNGTFSASHIYRACGTFTVTVDMFDNNNAHASASVLVNVSSPPSVSLTDATNQEGDSTVVQGMLVTDEPVTSATGTLAWGDGTTTTFWLSGGARSFILSHTVSVVVTDDDGDSATSPTRIITGPVSGWIMPVDPDCQPVVSIEACQSAVYGGNAAAFSIELSAPAAHTVRAWYWAAGGADHAEFEGEAWIAAGQTGFSVAVPTMADGLNMGQSESVTMDLGSVMGGTRGTPTDAAVSIIQVQPTVIVSDCKSPEGRLADFSVSLSYAVNYAVEVFYSTADGSGNDAAQAGTDYQATSGTVWIPAADLSAPAPISVPTFFDLREPENLPDADDEIADEGFAVNLTGAIGARFPQYPYSVPGTITHNRPVVSINNVTVDAGKTATFTVTLSHTAVYPISLEYHTVDGTAIEGTDYIGTSIDGSEDAGHYSPGADRTLWIFPGKLFATITVPTKEDDDASSTSLNFEVIADDIVGALGTEIETGLLGDTTFQYCSMAEGNINPPPVAVDDGVYDTLVGVPLTESRGNGVLANDKGDAATLVAQVVSRPAHGTLALSGDGSFVYTPNADFFGADSFKYK
ncbi:MAG: Ig-like domain-containing protein, partial [Thermoguttaceae bacterium]